MINNKNQLTTTAETGVALRNASKSLKITNKLLAEVDDFEKYWEWWLSLDDEGKAVLLKDGLGLDIVDYGWKWGEIVDNDQERISYITRLDIDWHDRKTMRKIISSIVGLEEINLYENPVTLNILSKLLYLRRLNISKNWYTECDWIISIECLSPLINLEILEMDYNFIEDLSPIKNSKSLKFLSVIHNKISDISVISELTNLENLNLSENFIIDILSLSNLINLRTLNLKDNRITDISGLKSLKKLTNLEMSWEYVENLEVLGCLTYLQKLDLTIVDSMIGDISEGNICDISFLENLIQLNELTIIRHKVKNISPLKNLTQLKFLALGSDKLDGNYTVYGNYIEDISALENLVELESLFLTDNKINDISILKSLGKLTKLGLAGNNISDISVLKYLENLKWLQLGLIEANEIVYGNQIKDISCLALLKNLEYLDLSGNPIKDISSLAYLKNLKWLILQSNNINHSDIEWLREQLPNCEIFFEN